MVEEQSKQTQCKRILKYIESKGSITSAEAMDDLGIFRLASRIHDLKNLGFPIVSVFESGENRYGEPTHYKRYSLEA